MAYIGNVPAQKYVSLAAQHFTVTATTSYTLTHAVTTEVDIALFINNVRQEPGSSYSYTATGTALTLSAATAATDTMYCVYLGKAIGTITPPDNSISSAKIVDGAVTNNDLAGAITSAKITSLDATKLTGTVADARIPESAVTQHVPATDLSPVRSDILKLAIHQGVDGNRAAFNLDNSFIDTFEDDTGITTETDTDRNVSGEYVSSLTSVALDTGKNIAPSSNDFDYAYDGSDDWTVAGNTLGDHTIGADIKTVVHADSSISSLHTFKGAFVITFTLTAKAMLGFGVHAIDEDDTRAQNDRGGLQSMTNSFVWHDDYYSSGAQAAIGSTAEGSFTSPANGSVIVMRRIADGTITLEDDGVVLHTYSSTYAGDMRLCFSASGGTTPDVDNLKFEDTDKVQRDGHIHETINSGMGFGDAVSSSKHVGQLWTPTRSGNVTGFKIDIQTVSAALTCHVEIWTHDGTNPAAQVGGDSDSLSLSVAILSGTFSGTLPTVKKGTRYWVIFVDEGTSGNAVIRQVATAYGTDTGRNDTLASMTDGGLTALKIEVQVDTSAGEPTPDHNTLLLIKSNTTDASTTFVDSSPFNRTSSMTVVGTTQHDTAQNTLSQSSAMLFDGNSDFIHVPQSTDFNMTGAFTIEVVVRFAALGTLEGLMSNSISGATYGTLGYHLSKQAENTITTEISNGSGGPHLTSSTVMSADTWYHIAVVRLPSNRVDLYINGTSEANGTLSGTVNDPAVTKIGAKASAANGSSPLNFLNGWIQEARISNVARWDANFTPPTAAYLITPSTTFSIGPTGTLISDTQTASTSRTTASGVMIYEDGAGTSTLGTDLKIYFTANNGTNWTEASSYGTATTYSGAKKLVKLGSTTVTAGTQVAMKAVWANQAASKEARIHGWAVNY